MLGNIATLAGAALADARDGGTRLAAFGIRTGRAPRDWGQVQPRAQLVWRVTTDGRDVVRIGAGLFTAQLPYYAQHNQLLYTGSSLADIDLRGTSVPVPDFPAYRADPSTVPGLPAGGALHRRT